MRLVKKLERESELYLRHLTIQIAHNHYLKLQIAELKAALRLSRTKRR